MNNSTKDNHNNHKHNTYMYYFDKRPILMDKSVKFDQVFDDEFSKTTSLQNTQTQNFKPNKSMSYLNPSQNNQNISPVVINQQLQSTNTHQFSSKEVYEILKEQYQKTKGFFEFRPNPLLKFLLEYRGFDKRHLKVPSKISPLLTIDNQTLEQMLNDEYKKLLKQQEQQKTKKENWVKKLNSHSSAKFTNETMKRLYPKLKENPLENVKDYKNIDKVFERVVYHYYYKNGDFKGTNDENIILQFWHNIPPEERKQYNLDYEAGENAFTSGLLEYMQDDAIMDRLSNLFKSICGYYCYHPTPLHNYWEKQISYPEKFMKGLYKHDSDTLYQILDTRYLANKEKNEKLKEEAEKEANTFKEKEKAKYKVEKDNYLKILNKFKKLAAPKDKWRTGKVMLRLRNKFSYDNILYKMIKNEFSTNRPFKLSDEYQIYDSDEERKTIFKLEREKKISKENEERILENISKAKIRDNELILKEEKELNKIREEDQALERYFRKEVVKYFKRNLKENPSTSKKQKLLRTIYAFLKKKHYNACQRKFPKDSNYGKKSRSKMVPKELVSYFNKVFNRLFIDGDGKVFFSKLDNMSFWAPCHSNKCKIHSETSCPLYCLNNTQNREIALQRQMNFRMVHDSHRKILEDERLNLWKRKDLIEDKFTMFNINKSIIS